MELNGHELEQRYISKIYELERATHHPHWTDKLWVPKFKRQLKKRMEKLKRDRDNGLIDPNAFEIWVNMIKEVI